MYTYLFFDDQKLFGRDNLVRRQGQPTLTSDAIYNDGICVTSIPGVFVLPLADGRWRMVYQGKCDETALHWCFAAISTDGIHFVPEDTRAVIQLQNRIADHQVLEPYDAEIACILQDPAAPADKRWKMLMCEYEHTRHRVLDKVYTSPDGLQWTLLEGACWNPTGTEPVTGAVYRPEKHDFCIYPRHIWGERRVGITTTADWMSYAPVQHCMQTDALDEPLAEMYGMPVFRYEDRYIGLPHIYGGLHSEYNSKFMGGTMKQQLAWSPDGEHWQRMLRTPFIDGESEAIAGAVGYPCKMTWPSAPWQMPDGEIRIAAAATRLEHGTAFKDLGGADVQEYRQDAPDCTAANTVSGRSGIHIYRLRRDGFVCLATDGDIPGTLLTREMLWQGGEVQVNLTAAHATLAVYESAVAGDAFGHGTPVPGYGHEDCVPFSGDDTAWQPSWDGKGLDALVGRTLSLELRLTDGRVYALRGDCLPMCNTDAMRWRLFGAVPPLRL